MALERLVDRGIGAARVGMRPLAVLCAVGAVAHRPACTRADAVHGLLSVQTRMGIGREADGGPGIGRIGMGMLLVGMGMGVVGGVAGGRGVSRGREVFLSRHTTVASLAIAARALGLG